MMDATHTASSPPAYIFPILKPSEIVQCLRELSIDISSSELSEPARHKEALRNVFTTVLTVCAGKTEEELQAAAVELAKASSELPFPEMHEADNFSELAFFDSMRNLLIICGYNEFSWRDFYAPEPKRLRVQLSALINLAKFREDHLKLYVEMTEGREKIIAEIQQANAENIEVHEQYEITQKECESNFQEMEEVLKECQELEVEIARNNKLQSSAREEAAALKKKANDLKDELATSVWALQEAEAEEERLRQQVVTSPDRRRAEMANRRERLDQVKQECASLGQEVQTTKTKILNVTNVSKSLESVNSTLTEMKSVAVKNGDFVRQLEGTNSQIKTIEKQTMEYTKATEQCERELQRLDDKIVHQRQQHKLQLDAVQEAIQTTKSQLLAVEKDRRDGMAKVEASELEVKKLEETIERENTQAEQEMNDMIAEYQEVESLFLKRNEHRMAQIEA